LGRSWGLLGVILEPPKASWVIFGGPWDDLGIFWVPFGSSLGRPSLLYHKARSDRAGSGDILGRSWGLLGVILGPPGASWVIFGVVMEPLGVVLGPLVVVLSPLEAVLGHLASPCRGQSRAGLGELLAGKVVPCRARWRTC